MMTYSETTQRPKKARKEHVCDECKTTIAKGTVYIGNSSVIDGKYEPMRRHMDCIAAADLLDAECTVSGTYSRFLLTVLIAKNPDIKPKLKALLVDFPEVLARLNAAL